jgi:transcriptional regulator of heat shock response
VDEIVDARLRDVLVEVLEEYVETAHPVSSRSVAERLPISSATVRSAMAALTEGGLLSQPHTSAGRVPTERAFRLYVQRWMREAPLPRGARTRAEGELAGTAGDAEGLLRCGADLLSHLTGQPGFLVPAGSAGPSLRRALFVRLSSLLGQPEFADTRRLRDLLAALEEEERMGRLLGRLLRSDDVQVAIGTELDEPAMEDCALVAAPLGGASAQGGLGVLGPVRMRYAHVIPVVRQVSELVGTYLS